jgi:hypothetical protein
VWAKLRWEITRLSSLGPFQYIVVRVTSYFRHLASAPVHWQRQEPELQAVVRRSYKHIPRGFNRDLNSIPSNWPELVVHMASLSSWFVYEPIVVPIGHRRYVYGTRSELRVAYILIMYFCYFEKLEMDVAMEEVARLRPVTKPHVELWLTVDDLMCTPTHRSVIAAHDYEEVREPIKQTAQEGK